MIQCQSISRWVAPVTNRSTQTANCKHKWSLENFIKPKSYIVKERKHHSMHSKKWGIFKTLHPMQEFKTVYNLFAITTGMECALWKKPSET